MQERPNIDATKTDRKSGENTLDTDMCIGKNCTHSPNGVRVGEKDNTFLALGTVFIAKASGGEVGRCQDEQQGRIESEFELHLRAREVDCG